MNLIERITKAFTALLRSRRDLPVEDPTTAIDKPSNMPLEFSDLSQIVQIEGTQIYEGTTPEGSLTAYDCERGRFLFGEPTPDLWYIGKLQGKHIAIKQDKVSDSHWVTYIVDEDDNLLFGRKFDTDSLSLVCSRSEDPIEIDIYDNGPIQLRNKLRGTENVLIEFDGEENLNSRLRFYNINGALLNKCDIPSFAEEELAGSRFGTAKEDKLKPATKIQFVKIDDKKFVEVTYDKKREIFELE